MESALGARSWLYVLLVRGRRAVACIAGQKAPGYLEGSLVSASRGSAVDAVVGDGGAEGLQDVERDGAELRAELGAGGVGEAGR